MFDAIVLAGGAARRLGGADKPGLLVGGSSLLERAVAAVAGAGRVVVVGPRRDLARPVVWCREDPPGGGPVAAVAAGLDDVRAEIVLVLAADLPDIAPAVGELVGALREYPADVAVLVGTDGRANHLAAAWRTAALRRAIAALDSPAGAAMRSLLLDAEFIEVRDRGGWGADCDTWDDLAAARGRATPSHHDHSATEQYTKGDAMTNPLDAWVNELAAGLGVDPAVDTVLMLDVARDAARGIARPAAPVTTFLVGLAAGLRGGAPDAVRAAAETAQRLAAAHVPPDAPPEAP